MGSPLSLLSHTLLAIRNGKHNNHKKQFVPTKSKNQRNQTRNFNYLSMRKCAGWVNMR
jgi:hypothetical protein